MTLIPPRIISAAAFESIGQGAFRSASASHATVTDGVTYIPFRLRMPKTFSHMFWFAGSAASGNIDMGIYDEKGTLLAHTGSQVMPTGSTVFALSGGAIRIGPGLFYMAVVADNALGSIWSWTVPDGFFGQSLGLLIDANLVFPLPAVASFAAATSNWAVPLIAVCDDGNL